MNILCVEDERVIARHIEALVGQILANQDYHFSYAQDLDDAETILQTRDIDLVLLDLNLHGQSGFTLLSRVVAQSFSTVIISANTQEALKAFEYGVLDFVAKPFDLARLTQAIERVQQNRTAGAGARYLWVKRASQLCKVVVAEIQYIKGAGSYAELHMLDGQVLLHDKNLEKLLACLPQTFVRIHKSYLLDSRTIKAINSYPGSKYEVSLADGTTLPVSRQKVAYLKRLS
ncbi:MAG: two-component system response regulator LytT [Phenylobacterium sp.]